jgi:hypothetical protein
MQPSTPDYLAHILQAQMRNYQDLGLYLVSMDHCPSEQLSPNIDWHTTVLILSPAMQHAALAHHLASRLRPKTTKLMKWVNATKKYRQTFLDVFFDELVAYPSVCVFALSAKKTAISQSLNHFIEEFGLQDRYRPTAGGSVSFGPFVRIANGEPVTVTLSENRAIMCLFVAHFVWRIHRRMYEATNTANPEPISHVNWNFLGDKFPGQLGDDMDLMFTILTNCDYSRGRISWGYFHQGGQVETDLLVDNLAGALDFAVNHSRPLAQGLKLEQPSGLFYWEQWEE